MSFACLFTGGLGQEVEGHDQDDGQGREEGHLIETLTDDVDTGHPRLIGMLSSILIYYCKPRTSVNIL